MEGRYYAFVLTLIAAVLIAVLSNHLASARSASHNLTVELILNNTDNMVHVGPAGTDTNASLLGSGTAYTHPTHSYLTSRSGNTLIGLVALDSNFVNVSNATGTHSLEINQNTSDYFILAFTKGDWRAVDNRMTSIESGNFMHEIAPSFGYGLGLLFPLKFVLNASGIDIQNNLILNPGYHDILIDYNETDSTTNRPMFSIKRI